MGNRCLNDYNCSCQIRNIVIQSRGPFASFDFIFFSFYCNKDLKGCSFTLKKKKTIEIVGFFTSVLHIDFLW